MAKSQSGGALNNFVTTEPVPIVFAAVILLALIGLALLRHFFGSIRVDAGTR